MSIPDHARANFQTLLRAAAEGNLALLECTDAATGATRYVICAVGRAEGDFVFTPFGHLADGNPYEAYVPPAADTPPSPDPSPDGDLPLPVYAGKTDRAVLRCRVRLGRIHDELRHAGDARTDAARRTIAEGQRRVGKRGAGEKLVTTHGGDGFGLRRLCNARRRIACTSRQQNGSQPEPRAEPDYQRNHHDYADHLSLHRHLLAIMATPMPGRLRKGTALRIVVDGRV